MAEQGRWTQLVTEWYGEGGGGAGGAHDAVAGIAAELDLTEVAVARARAVATDMDAAGYAPEQARVAAEEAPRGPPRILWHSMSRK